MSALLPFAKAKAPSKDSVESVRYFSDTDDETQRRKTYQTLLLIGSADGINKKDVEPWLRGRLRGRAKCHIDAYVKEALGKLEFAKLLPNFNQVRFASTIA